MLIYSEVCLIGHRYYSVKKVRLLNSSALSSAVCYWTQMFFCEKYVHSYNSAVCWENPTKRILQNPKRCKPRPQFHPLVFTKGGGFCIPSRSGNFVFFLCMRDCECTVELIPSPYEREGGGEGFGGFPHIFHVNLSIIDGLKKFSLSPTQIVTLVEYLA